MISMKDLWNELSDNGTLNIRIRTEQIKDLKGKLSRYKYRKMQAAKNKNLRLKIEAISEIRGITTLQLTLHGSESGGMLDIEIVEEWEDESIPNEY